ncbi:13229_t:CDS:1 [Dentiscutata heterogama]|uniref:13229_t:CDS:1 n=1 Tax=Dentiscutata heterogama TaxID=1316150 RepID=A0ACA9N6V2_9GLOM|nr:13229_t:CDS:1 [Dentiscutata heterogama]
MQTQKQQSAQNGRDVALDQVDIINKITNILHRNTDGVIKEITNVLLLRNKELEEQLEEMQRRNKELENQVENNKKEAQKNIERLTREASKYQSALGRATNVRLGNDDLNNSCQLREDIKTLKKNLEKFTVVKPAKDFDIIKDRAYLLLKKYKCTNFIDDGHYKSLLQAAMQRFILETSIKYIAGFFSSTEHSTLETQIDQNTKILLNVIDDFAKFRKGNDDITPTLSIKLRQQIYSVLGNRGFNPIASPEGTTEHPFISHLQQKLVLAANQFRIVKDLTKNKSFNDIAIKLARDVIKIFFFRLKVQEQIADPPVWFECNTRVNPDLMEGAFDSDHYQDDVVQICAFPLIGIDLNNDEKRKILSQANVYITRRMNN